MEKTVRATPFVGEGRYPRGGVMADRLGSKKYLFSETTKINFYHKVNHLTYLDFCVHFFSILHIYLSLYNLSVEIIRSLICLISSKTTVLETLFITIIFASLVRLLFL